MEHRKLAVVTIIALALALAAPVGAATVSPGKTIAVTSGANSGTILGSPFAFVVQLERAKRKTIILIDATVSFTGGSGGSRNIDLVAHVDNGDIFANAEGGPIQVRCELNADCTLSGQWWVDVDLLEAANPGAWANKFVTIDVIGHTTAGPAPAAAWYTLRAHAVKK